MKVCPQCGTELHAGAAVCKGCGARLATPDTETEASATGAPAGRAPQAAGRPSQPIGRPSQMGDAALAQFQRSVAEFYKVERLLGRGRMTTVYRAVGLTPPRPVALKVLPRGLGVGPAAAPFKDEVRKAQALTHPNIVPIYTIGLRAGAPYFVAVKLVEGRSLDAVIESEGALPLPAIIVVLRATAEALNYAHERGTIHGNLTAANILLDTNGRAVVSDFGIARALEAALPGEAGRLRFLSPEEAGGGAAGSPSDQYSLGILALQMLTGSASADPDSLVSLRNVNWGRGGLPDGLANVVQKALAPDPAQRYPRTFDMLAALRAIPFTEADRREGLAALGRLVRGEPVPVSTTAKAPRRDAAPVGNVAAPKPARPTVPALPVTVREPAVPVVEATPTVEAVPAVDSVPAPSAEPVPVEPAEVTVRASGAMRASGSVRVSGVARATPTVNFVFAASAEPAPKWRMRAVWAAAALLVIAGLAFAGYWWLGRSPTAGQTAQARIASQGASLPASSATGAVRAATDSSRSDGARQGSAAVDSTGTRAAGPPEATGLLLFTAVPATADIFVDGKPTGSDGVVDSEVTAGRRHLEVSAPGYEALDTVIRVSPGSTVNLGRISLRDATAQGADAATQGTGRLRLRAIPPTAEIFVDGRPVGVGSLVDFEVASGFRQLRITAAGYQPLDTLIAVDAGVTVRLGQISLKSVPAGP